MEFTGFLRKYKLFLKESKFSKEIQASNSGGFLISLKRERASEGGRDREKEGESERERETPRER